MKVRSRRFLKVLLRCAIVMPILGFDFCGPHKPEGTPAETEPAIPAVTAVRQALADKNPVTRGMAAATVLRFEYRSLAPELLRLLRDDSEANVRTACAIALAGLGEKQAAPLVAQMLERKQGQPDLLLDALGQLKAVQYGGVALPYLAHPDNLTRLKAAESIAAMNAVRLGGPILAQARLQKKDDIVQAHISVLGRLAYAGSEDYILQVLQKNPDGTLAAAAYLALGRIRSRKSIPIFLAALRGKDAKLQENAAVSLRLMPFAESASGLFALVTNSQEELALLATDILADYPAALTLKGARALAFGDDATRQAPGAFILGKSKDIQSRQRIESLLRSKETPNREMVARSLGYLNQSESIALLREVALEDQGNARYGAIWSLGIMRAKAALPEIRKALASSDKQMTAYAIEALSAMPEKEDIDLLKKYLDTRDGLNILAATAIARVEDDSARITLEAAAKSNRAHVKTAALEALAMRADPKSIPFLISLLSDTDAETRKQIINVLRSITGLKYSTAQQWLTWFREKPPK